MWSSLHRSVGFLYVFCGVLCGHYVGIYVCFLRAICAALVGHAVVHSVTVCNFECTVLTSIFRKNFENFEKTMSNVMTKKIKLPKVFFFHFFYVFADNDDFVMIWLSYQNFDLKKIKKKKKKNFFFCLEFF